MSFRATCLTLFPEAFPGLLGVSIVGNALEKGLWELETIDIRSFGLGKHRTVDDTPSGGGAGMGRWFEYAMGAAAQSDPAIG